MKSFSILFSIMIATNFSHILISSQLPEYKAERAELFRSKAMCSKFKPEDCKVRAIGKNPGAQRKVSNRMLKLDGLSVSEALQQADLVGWFSYHKTGDKRYSDSSRGEYHEEDDEKNWDDASFNGFYPGD